MDKDRVEAHCNGEYWYVCILVQSTPLLKLRAHAQTRIHAFSASDAFAEPSKNGKWRTNERRRSLCDGGGAAVFLAKPPEKCRALSKISEMSAPQIHKSTNLANASQTVCFGGGGDEPMRAAKGADAHPLAMSPSTMRQWPSGRFHAHISTQSNHPVYVCKYVSGDEK
jgi:hypothetical protein